MAKAKQVEYTVIDTIQVTYILSEEEFSRLKSEPEMAKAIKEVLTADDALVGNRKVFIGTK